MRLSLHALAFGAMAVASLFGPPAQAALITYVGQCTVDCAEIGLNAGDGVLATVTVNDAAIAPNAVLGNADVTAFTLDFGTVDIDFASQHGFLLLATLNAAGDGLVAFAFGASEAAFGEDEAETVGIVHQFNLWRASETGDCASADCTLLGFSGGAEGVNFALVLDVTEVPEPSSALLLGAALLGLAGTARRWRAKGAPRRKSSVRLSLPALALGATMAAAGLTGLAAQAAVITYTGTCTEDCALIGLAVGDGVTATVIVNDAAFAPNALLDSADVTGFTVDFGSVDIDFASQQGFSFAATLNGTADGFVDFRLFASEALDPDRADAVAIQYFPDFAVDRWVATELGRCIGAACDSLGTGSDANAADGELAALTLVVPEPSSVLLFGAALLGLAGTARRRRV